MVRKKENKFISIAIPVHQIEILRSFKVHERQPIWEILDKIIEVYVKENKRYERIEKDGNEKTNTKATI